jgi:preprotein translocase subunit SecA
MPLTRNEDRVWFNTHVRLQQIRSAVVSAQTVNSSVLVLSHFEQTVSQIATLLREAGISYERFTSFHSAHLCHVTKPTIWLGLVRAFEPPSPLLSVSIPGKLDLVVTEHYPLQSKDQELIDAAGRLPCDGELTFHFSLDDPLLQHFGGESLQELMRRLGLSEWECISHHLVTTAIRGAQEKIEKTVSRDVPAHSVEDWFKYNLRSAK